MKKTVKIPLILLSIVGIPIILWFVLLAFNTEPYYENNHMLTIETSYSETLLSSDEAIDDVQQYVSEIKNDHPTPFLFISEYDFDRKVSRIISELARDHEISVGDLYLKLSELTGLIDDSHTWVIAPQNWQKVYLPFSVLYRNDKFYNMTEETTIPYKAEILSINSVKVDTLYEMVAKHANTSLKSGTDKFVESWFATYIPHLLNLENSCVVEYHFENGVKTKRLSLSKTHPIPYNYKSEIATYYEYRHDGKRLPVLELNGFYGDSESFVKTIEDFFAKYGDAERIVIDIRQNTGGEDSWGYYVFNHFANDTYQLMDDFIIKVNDKTKKYYQFVRDYTLYHKKIPSLFWNFPLFYDNPIYSDIMSSETGKNLSMGKFTENNSISESKRYKGKVYLLIGGNTASGAVNLARIFQANFENGAILGEETKHPKSYSGNMSKYYLPFSKLGYTIPHTFSVAPSDREWKRGVIPDYSLNFEINDYKDGRDPELDYLLAH